MLQRSDEWFEVRRGKFTGSENHKLLGQKGLGLTGESYALKKAIELVIGIDDQEQFASFDTQRGIELEPVAFKKFKELKELDFIDVLETSFFAYGNDAGATPDGLVGDDGVLEIKCPKPDKFFKLIKDGEKAIDFEYQVQMQMEMLVTNSTKCHFFNYVIFKGKEMWHEIIVNRDEKVIDLLKARIDEAVIKRNEFINQIKDNMQF